MAFRDFPELVSGIIINNTVCNLNPPDSSAPSGCLIILVQQSDLSDLVNNVGLLAVLLLNWSRLGLESCEILESDVYSPLSAGHK